MPKGKVKKIETLDQADQRIVHLESIVRSINEHLSKISPPAIDASVKAMNEEASRIHSGMSVLILKLSVFTEMPRYFHRRNVPPNLYLPKMLPLFDLPDDWWRKHGNMSMQGWSEVIAKAEIPSAAA